MSYKTTDGGRNWTRALFVDEDTGVIDLALDPESPHILYAAAYQMRRTAFGFNGAGPNSGIYKTTDAGDTWARLSNDLPKGDTGRIGLDVYPATHASCTPSSRTMTEGCFGPRIGESRGRE